MPPVRALHDPSEAGRPRLNRMVLPFREALEDLKTTISGLVQCAAINAHGRCPKIIEIRNSDVDFLLEQLTATNLNDVFEITHLMLCSRHWRDTVFAAALFLDFFSHSELKQNSQVYENIVVDLESARAIKEEEELSELKFANSSSDMKTDHERQVSAVNNSNKSSFFGNFNDIQIPSSPTNSEHLSNTIPATSSTLSTILEANSGEETNKESKGHVNGAGTSNKTANKIPGLLSVISLNSYASLELGVARLEIMFQKSVKCISMAPSGWRCQEIISNERLPEARRLLSSLSGSVDELENLSRLMLCPRHSAGDLPRLYSEAWSAFTAKRLPTREAIAKFDAGNRHHIQFFGDKSAQQTESEKFEFDFNFRCTQPGIRSAEHGSLESESSIPYSKTPQGDKLDVRGRTQHENFHLVSEHISKLTPDPRKLADSSSNHGNSSIQSKSSTETPPATTSPIFKVPAIPPSPSPVPQVSTPVANRIETLGSLSNTPDHDTESASRLGIVESTEDRNSPFYSEKRIKIPFPSSSSPRRSIIVKLPPTASNVPNEISDLSSALSRSKISNEASNPYRISSSTPADIHDTVTNKEKEDSPTPQPRQKSAPPTLQRDVRPPPPISSQSTIDDNIINEMRQPISRGGFVYILKSTDRHLVKIGKTTNLDRRIQEIKTCCQLADLAEVDSGSKRIPYPERVERLAHLELRNFRKYVGCAHLRYGNNDEEEGEEVQREHREWFDVPAEVAVKSVRRWRRFVEVAYTPQGMLSESWQLKVGELPDAGEEEKMCLRGGLEEGGGLQMGDHHRLRDERYRKWMGEA